MAKTITQKEFLAELQISEIARVSRKLQGAKSAADVELYSARLAILRGPNPFALPPDFYEDDRRERESKGES